MSKTFQRAKSPAQKAIRRAQILAAAEKHFEAERYEKVSLDAIATEVGITKAALYRYFRTKESLFLALFTREFAAVVAAVQTGHGKTAAALLTQVLAAHPMYCRLSAILHTALESNVTEEEAVDLKLGLLDGMQAVSAVLVERYGFTHQDAIDRLFQVQQAVIGCWHMCDPKEPVATVIKRDDLKVFDRDFATALKDHLERIFLA